MNVTDLRKQMLMLQNKEANLILDHIDEETGEIPTNIFDILEEVGHDKQLIVDSTIESYNEFTDLLTYIDAKIKRLQDIKKSYTNTTTSIKNILQKHLPEGENINSDSYRISWRKSEVIEISDFASIREIEEKHPQVVKTVKSLNKTEAKKLLKQGVEIEGVHLVKKNNIQIK